MIRLTPTVVTARELVARPLSRGRVQGLSRLTAPTHGTGFWLALWAAVAAAGFVALIPELFDRGPSLPGFDLVNRLAGISFAASGLIAWRRRPDSAVGSMLTAAGFGVLAEPILGQVDSPLTWTA